MTTTDSARVLLPPSLPFERYGADGEVGMLRLSRAAKRNALNDATVLGLEAFFSAPPAGVRAVVLDAEGDALLRRAGPVRADRAGRVRGRWSTPGCGTGRSTGSSPARVPVISVLKGAVVGGGLELASATHLRVAEPSAFYALAGGAARAVRRRRRFGADAAADRGAPDGRHDAHRPGARRAGGPGAGPFALPHRRGRGPREGAGAGREDRGELTGHELRRAAGAAADRAGEPRRGVPAWNR